MSFFNIKKPIKEEKIYYLDFKLIKDRSARTAIEFILLLHQYPMTRKIEPAWSVKESLYMFFPKKFQKFFKEEI
jgi:hypothetical protein